jgi:hypothetical protein
MRKELASIRKKGLPKAGQEPEVETDDLVIESDEAGESLAPGDEAAESPEEEATELEALPDDVILEEARRRGLV